MGVGGKVWGGGVVSPFNYISINIGGQPVPLSQVSLSSVQLRVIELEILSLSLLCSSQDGSRPLLLPAATPEASKYLPRDEHIPRVLSVTDPDRITAQGRSAERGKQKPNARHKEKSLPKRAHEKRLAMDGNKVALEGSLPSRILRWCLQNPSDWKTRGNGVMKNTQ